MADDGPSAACLRTAARLEAAGWSGKMKGGAESGWCSVSAWRDGAFVLALWHRTEGGGWKAHRAWLAPRGKTETHRVSFAELRDLSAADAS